MPDELTIRLRGLEAFGRHGVFPEERALGQRFVVDIDLRLLHCPAITSDALADTVDYGRLSADITAILGGPPCALLEYVAGRIADRALAEPLAAEVAVTLRKPHVALPVPLEFAGVSLRRARSHRYWLGLGSNLGERSANLQALVDGLRGAGIVVEAISAVYETAPQLVTQQPAFLNAVVRVRTELPPPDLLGVAKAVERQAGRVGGERRYGPRVADCDLLVWDGGDWNDERLTIPHPRLAERRFALVPLVEIDPALVLPDGRAVGSLAAALDPGDQAVTRVNAGVH